MFHLACVNLPDHPPRGIAWFCLNCRKNFSATRRDGLRFHGHALETWIGELEADEKEEEDNRHKVEVGNGMRKEDEEVHGGYDLMFEREEG
jgi:hypothetical protein